ncbi:MAG TPA: polysaccharide biosynthesis protein [Syntrophomonadaceae bacterium]|nr:polysaccharide biosynthesis protein [Syntrophomonadaceae bacterium]
MKPESFLHGAFVLTVAGIVVKVLGAVYRIPFTRIVGSEGVGLYQMAYPIYTALLAFSTSGIPIAVSLLVAEKVACGDRTGARQVFYLSLGPLFFLGLFLSLALFRAAPYLAGEVLGDPRAYYPLAGIAPAVFVISIVSAFRGYFQGWRLMWPTALSEVVDQVIRVGTVFWAALSLTNRGVEFAAAGAAFGAVTGGCGSLFVLGCLYRWLERRNFTPAPGRRMPVGFRGSLGMLRRLIAYALPVSAGSMVLPLVQTIDAVIIPKRLQAGGYTVQQATSLFGQFSGMAGTLVYIPAIFTVSLASSLVPHVAASLAQGNREEAGERIATAMRITTILCLPAAAGLMALAAPITDFLFGDPGAGEVTAWLAPAALFSGLQQTTSGALQGLGNTWLPVLNLAVGCAVKTLCNYYLTVLPGLGVKGAALGSILGFAVSFFLNYWGVRALTRRRAARLGLPRPLLAATIMMAALPVVYRLLESLGNAAATGLAVVAGAAIYFAVLILTKEIDIVDLRRFTRR